MANAMVRTVRPKAKATPRKPIPRVGKPADSTAAPHPPKTSQKVPKNSAAARLPMLMISSRSELGCLSRFGFYPAAALADAIKCHRPTPEKYEREGDRGQG